ncbi:MAG: hypothetical protein EP298_06340 [Gammaproteobacteria bacterium]|nr:MAG: hypothetical protein EP298_06340 [Gammaproteobacteria bacterium]UTW43268.1 hypothetical protein KFE69_03760 [bacterium SCSIO 12844]
MKFHAVIDMDDLEYRKPFFNSLASDDVTIELPQPIINPNVHMTGVQWVNKLKENNLNVEERQYVDHMREIAKKYDALAIPAGSWDGLSSQNYSEHRNRKAGSNFFLYLPKPETLTSQEMADLTAIHCHKELQHPIVGECHGLQAYHLYHGGKLGVFEAGIILECNEDPSLRLNDGKFEHKPNQCADSVSSPNSSWHQDWNHNTFALCTDGVDYQEVVTSHPLQSTQLTWSAKPSKVESSGIHVINGLNRWLASYELEDDFRVTVKKQNIGLSGCYLVLEKDEDYESDGERGKGDYTSKSEKIYHAANWAKMHDTADDMSKEYQSIINTVAMLKGLTFEAVEKNFKETIFNYIAKAYIEKIPGGIISRIANNKDYLTQYHPSKSAELGCGANELGQRNQLMLGVKPDGNPGCLFYAEDRVMDKKNGLSGDKAYSLV